MTKELWINLPVKNILKSREFFTQIGFELNTQYGNSENSACFFVGTKKIVIMLFEESAFKGVVRNTVSDAKTASEVLFSFDAENKEEVDMIAVKIKKAGGILFSEPAEFHGWMYGFGFCDIDHHRWNVLYMDMSKMPKTVKE